MFKSIVKSLGLKIAKWVDAVVTVVKKIGSWFAGIFKKIVGFFKNKIGERKIKKTLKKADKYTVEELVEELNKDLEYLTPERRTEFVVGLYPAFTKWKETNCPDCEWDIVVDFENLKFDLGTALKSNEGQRLNRQQRRQQQRNHKKGA